MPTSFEQFLSYFSYAFGFVQLENVHILGLHAVTNNPLFGYSTRASNIASDDFKHEELCGGEIIPQQEICKDKSNDLGDNFVDDIADCYWPKMIWVGNSFLLGYEGENSGIQGRDNLARSS